MVARGEPFQLTTESLVKFVPVTVSVNPLGLQYGAEACDVVDAESDVIAGGVPGFGVTVKMTMLETSVVVVTFPLFGLEVGDTAEPGMSIAICTGPAFVRSETGTGAVSCVELTNVVVSPAPFHKMNAPLTKPVPLAVIVKPCPPTGQVVGLTKVSVEEDVWTLRFVLYCEHADASVQSSSATPSHLWEPIRTRSLTRQAPSRARTQARRPAGELGSRKRIRNIPGAEEKRAMVQEFGPSSNWKPS